MKYRLQYSPQSGTREPYTRAALETPIADSNETKLFRSWLVYDSDFEGQGTHSRFNWHRALGFALAAGISAGFWIGVALLIERLWK